MSVTSANRPATSPTAAPGSAPVSPGWRPSQSALVMAVVGVGILVVGLLGSRPDVAVIAVPFVLSYAWGWFTRPADAPIVRLRRGPGVAQAGRVRGLLALPAAPGTQAFRIRVSAPGHRDAEALLAAGPEREIELSLETVRTGPQDAFRTDYVSSVYDEVFVAGPHTAKPLRVTVFPTARPLRRLPLPHQLQGLTGPHTSRRVGDGTDLHDVFVFTPGDRLRRIDWRASARRSLDPQTGRLGELYVRRTFATADATIMLVVDSRDNVGPDVSTWGGGRAAQVDEATSLDLAREAATSVARHYIDRGDRVGLDDLGRRRRPVAPAAGRRHLERISQRLAVMAPEGTPSARERAPQIPQSALVVVFSTFLDDEAMRICLQWQAQAHTVIAVDTMPAVYTRNLDAFSTTAYHLVRLERGVRLANLRRGGVRMVHWETDPDGHGSGRTADADLLILSRTGGPRGRR